MGLSLYCINLSLCNLFGKELSIWLTVRVFRECISICVYASFFLGFEGGMLNLIVSIPNHCLLIYLALSNVHLPLFYVYLSESYGPVRIISGAYITPLSINNYLMCFPFYLML